MATKSKSKPHTIRDLLFRVAILSIFIFSVVFFTDHKGWFDPDNTNNHAARKWDSYYQFTRTNNVDIVLIGNSHIYTGINPKNLSCALNANTFILAAPGTTITDAYYCLKEAITLSKPKIAVIETFAIKDYRSHDFTEGPLSDQLQSFQARKNVRQKLCATPVLFTSKHYLAAWSNTIRNHSYLLKDREQIERNIFMKRQIRRPQGLYLGRFVTDNTGMTDTTLRKYDIPGAASVVEGSEYAIGKEAIRAVEKIVSLCRKNDIQPIFLTIPMYYRHINDYDVWKERLEEALAPHQPVWFDLQSPFDYEAFIPECFENSVRANQHLSYQGSLVSTYKLAHFIHETFPALLPDRSLENKWHKLFYGEEGYFQNHPPSPSDPSVTILLRDKVISNLTLKEVSLFPGSEFLLMYIKIDKQDFPNSRGNVLILTVDMEFEGQQITTQIEAEGTHLYDPINHALFFSYLNKGVTIRGIREVEILQ